MHAAHIGIPFSAQPELVEGPVLVAGAWHNVILNQIQDPSCPKSQSRVGSNGP